MQSDFLDVPLNCAEMTPVLSSQVSPIYSFHCFQIRGLTLRGNITNLALSTMYDTKGATGKPLKVEPPADKPNLGDMEEQDGDGVASRSPHEQNGGDGDLDAHAPGRPNLCGGDGRDT
uniref:Uncharacterized protein n=1 Tax=Sphaerodactylus townsendi TaxID=933632 RepID=A0ACB8EC28_9SAUR